MVKSTIVSRAVVFGLILCMLILSVFIGLIHPACSDPHCAICCLLSSRASGLHLQVLTGMLVCLVLLIVRISQADSRAGYARNLVDEKVKISC